MIDKLCLGIPNQAIPAVYDASLSYTRQLAVMLYKINQLIDTVNELDPDAIEEVEERVISAFAAIAPSYSNTGTYAVYDFCIHADKLYRCLTPITEGESWTADHWVQVTVGGSIKTLKALIDSTATAIYNIIAAEYDATKTYAIYDFCMHTNKLYRCSTAITTAEAWTEAHWTEVTVGKAITDLKDIVMNNRTEYLTYISNMQPVIGTVTLEYDEWVNSQYVISPFSTLHNGDVVLFWAATSTDKETIVNCDIFGEIESGGSSVKFTCVTTPNIDIVLDYIIIRKAQTVS